LPTEPGWQRFLVSSGWAGSCAHAQDVGCADVKIEIRQELSPERQSFDAVVRINNGLQSDAMQIVGINPAFQHEAGNVTAGSTRPGRTVCATHSGSRG
jgi:hypothetical protein